ncbi:MAG: hypothetical protein IJI46_07260 [Erysipelotrichaceae bacterium]|nr:hypothetical protein [Erysipelotrichaceae bacterium]
MKYEINKEFMMLRNIPLMVYSPKEKSGRENIAVVLMHSNSNYFETPQAFAVAERGYLCFVSTATSHETTLDQKLVHLAKVVEYARAYPGVEQVLLFGHSGGATLMSAYQAIAEKGTAFFRSGRHVIDLDDIGELSPADGVMLIDANFGNGVMTLLSLDPSVIDENDPKKRDASLNLFDPANGYDPSGNCHFSDAFVKRYVRAQGERMNRLVAYARERVRAIEEGRGQFDDDEPFVIPGADQVGPLNKLFPQMPSFFSHTRDAWPLIHADDSVTEQIVPCVRDFRAGRDLTTSLHGSGVETTVKEFLKNTATLATEEFGYDETTLYGVDYKSSYCVTLGNVSYISIPMLMMGLTGSYEYITAEHAYHEAVSCADKTVAFVEGAGHNFMAEKEEYGDTVNSCFNYVDQWIQSRYFR